MCGRPFHAGEVGFDDVYFGAARQLRAQLPQAIAATGYRDNHLAAIGQLPTELGPEAGGGAGDQRRNF